MEQSLNFEMLRSQWPELAELACMAERYVHSDPESCLVKLLSLIHISSPRDA